MALDIAPEMCSKNMNIDINDLKTILEIKLIRKILFLGGNIRILVVFPFKLFY